MTKLFSYIAIALLITAANGPSVAFAGAGSESPPAMVDQLLAQTDGEESLTDEEKFTRAHDGLEKAITLTLDKINALTADLEGRTFGEESNEQTLKTEYLEKLSEFRTYHEERAEALTKLTTIEEIQALAHELRDYRDETYSPAIEDIVEFVLIFYTEDVTRVANERLDKINADIEKLVSLGLLEPEMFSGQLEEINRLLSEAEKLRMAAMELILNPPSPDATSTEETAAELTEPQPENATGTEASGAIASEEVADEAATEEETTPAVQTPRNMLEASLTNVKSAYSIFLEIGAAVKETLGLE